MATPIRLSQGKQKKIDTVSRLTEKISRAKACIFVDYRGLKHKQFEELRKNLKKLSAEFTVCKNRLMMRALDLKRSHPTEQGETCTELLTDTTATLFSYADEITPLKELLNYFKTAGLGKPKGGILGNTILTETHVIRLASLPAREVLLGNLAGVLNAPIQGLHYALSWNINKVVWALDAIKSTKH